MICSKCKKDYPEHLFYHYKDNTQMKICKKCFLLNYSLSIIPNKDFFKHFDIPYVPYYWRKFYYIASQKENKEDAKRALYGKYLAYFKLKGYKNFSYKDSFQFLNTCDYNESQYYQDFIDFIKTNYIEKGQVNEI